MRSSVLFTCWVSLLACQVSRAHPRDAGTRTGAPPPLASPIYVSGLQGEWQDFGWANRAPKKAGAEVMDLGGHGGWILANRSLKGVYGGLVFRYRAPAALGDFLQVRVDSERADIFPRVYPGPAHSRQLPDGWVEVLVPMTELNPTFAPFDRVVLRAHTSLPPGTLVEFDQVGLTLADSALLAQADAFAAAPGTPTELEVDCASMGRPISPLIYGIAYSASREDQSAHQWKLSPTARRWGGNPTSRYNWELGNAWNAGNDYFFRNLSYRGGADPAWQQFLTADRERHVASALTVPMLGWVAKDTSSYSFPVDELGPQQATDPDNPNSGNGLNKAGKPIGAAAPGRTSVPAPPDFVERWVKAIRKSDPAGGRSVAMYILDNEPMLWNDTHRDVHPEPLTYDELLKRTTLYADAVRRADPQAVIAGPASWGWTEYFYSALDAKVGTTARPDRRAHGDVPLIPWYLQQLREREKKTGQRTIDVLDVHFYPQGKGIGTGTNGGTDADTAQRRIRSTRALWDPLYRDESWIDEPVRLIPRMRDWVAENSPGLKLSIGEYNFGAERHPSGGIALAEALGRFGQQGLDSAFYWTYPPEGSAAFWAFRAYRDYDGKGSRFLDLSLPTRTSADTSLFASRNADGSKVTLVALNLSPKTTWEGRLILKGCAPVATTRVFSWAGDPAGFSQLPQPARSTVRMPPWSMTVVELALEPRQGP